MVILPAEFMPQPKITATTPAESGYAMPAEWEPHAATWLAWPHHQADWPGKMEAIRWVYGEMARKISPGETVRLLVRHPAEQKLAASHLQRAGCDLKKIEFIVHPTNRSWMRDTGPIFVKRSPKSKVQSPKSETAIVHFHFNAWARDNHWRKDRKIPEMASRLLGKKLFHAECSREDSIRTPHSALRNFVLEGGGIEVNGRGTLLTTEECYLHPTIQVRNPGMTRAQYDETFQKYLGVTNPLWLLKGPAGDDTHGHVDDICRFVNRKTLVLIREKNPRDINYKPLAENWERVREFRLEDGSARNRAAAHARAAVLRRPPAARELRELLHRQRLRHRADVQRPERPRRARHFGRIVPGPAGRRHSRRGFGARLRLAALPHAAAAGVKQVVGNDALNP